METDLIFLSIGCAHGFVVALEVHGVVRHQVHELFERHRVRIAVRIVEALNHLQCLFFGHVTIALLFRGDEVSQVQWQESNLERETR